MQEAINSQAVLPHSTWAWKLFKKASDLYGAKNEEQSQSPKGDIEPMTK
jgi:hypothetical protein